MLLFGFAAGLATSGLIILAHPLIAAARRRRRARRLARRWAGFRDWQARLDYRDRLREIRQTPWAPRPGLT